MTKYLPLPDTSQHCHIEERSFIENFGGNKLYSHYNENSHPIKTQTNRSDSVAHACKPGTWEHQEIETGLGNITRPGLKTIIA